jgi:hypothetical protein
VQNIGHPRAPIGETSSCFSGVDEPHRDKAAQIMRARIINISIIRHIEETLHRHSQHPNHTPLRISWLYTNTRIATSWPAHIFFIIIMSDHAGPVINKIRDFNVKYAAWAIKAPEALEERGWMKWIDLKTPMKQKEEDRSGIDIVEGIRAGVLLLQSIGCEHKNRIRDYITASQIWSALEVAFAYESREDEQCSKALLSQIGKTSAEDLDTFIARFDELTVQAGNAISGPIRNRNCRQG